MNVTKAGKIGRGRGTPTGTRRGRGGGRGRGRGRGAVNKSFQVVSLDEEDDVCNIAAQEFELDNSHLSKSFEELNTATELDGFDPMSGATWIYPTNRPVRDYQYEMVSTALFHNTLVSLPTGLGKTFISAVVMYNFQRWYPTGIVVFMAPTKPLVTQQLDACHNTVGISPIKTVELTGNINVKKREQLWKTKTVFFLTPQVFLSDIERNFFPLENIRCVVVDEAHKALGNHAIVQVVSKIAEKNRLFRVLALSATPGSDMIAVQQVLKNLLISKVEMRNDDSADVLPYVHGKKVETIVIPLDPYLKYIHGALLETFQIFTGKLLKSGALTGRDGSSFGKFQLLTAREMFRKTLAPKIPNYEKGFIEVDYAVAVSLAHSVELLLSHGLRSFYMYLQGVLNKEKATPVVTSELRKHPVLHELLEEIRLKLNISSENSTFDIDLNSTSGVFSAIGTSPKLNTSNIYYQDVDFTLSHPKLKKLKEIVHNHFLEYSTRNSTTRVMIFSQFRDSVQEIGNMLNSLRPMVKPMVFIGQASTGKSGRGLKQKDQVQVVQQFRDGGFNVLVSTSVGEEGLDIGEVDLIICYDTSNSPTRLIQRMGRTGRQREGRTVFLLTEGKEERSYSNSRNSHSKISKNITDVKKLKHFLYKCSPRMIPAGTEPACYKMSIVLSTEQDDKPEIIEVDISDDGEDSNDVSKPMPKPRPKKKSAQTGTESSSSKKKSASDVKQPKLTIAKMFEQIKHDVASKHVPEETLASSAIAVQSDMGHLESDIVLDLPDVVPDQPNLSYEDDDIHFVEDDIHILNHHKAFNSWSIYPKIFDIDENKRKEWRPCTNFRKDFAVNCAKVVSNKLEDIVLNESELADMFRRVKSQSSFSYSSKEFCDCGNAMETHDLKNVAKDVTSRPNSNCSLVDSISEMERNISPILNLKPNCTSQFQSPIRNMNSEHDDSSDCMSQFSASPDVNTNRYLEQCNEVMGHSTQITAADIARRDTLLSPTINLSEPILTKSSEPYSDTSSATCSLESNSEGSTKKKFVFRKKIGRVSSLPCFTSTPPHDYLKPTPFLKPTRENAKLEIPFDDDDDDSLDIDKSIFSQSILEDSYPTSKVPRRALSTVKETSITPVHQTSSPVATKSTEPNGSIPVSAILSPYEIKMPRNQPARQSMKSSLASVKKRFVFKSGFSETQTNESELPNEPSPPRKSIFGSMNQPKKISTSDLSLYECLNYPNNDEKSSMPTCIDLTNSEVPTTSSELPDEKKGHQSKFHFQKNKSKQTAELCTSNKSQFKSKHVWGNDDGDDDDDFKPSNLPFRYALNHQSTFPSQNNMRYSKSSWNVPSRLPSLSPSLTQSSVFRDMNNMTNVSRSPSLNRSFSSNNLNSFRQFTPAPSGNSNEMLEYIDEIPRQKRRKISRNPFIASQAAVSDGSDDSCDEDLGCGGLDLDDSFVTYEDNIAVTDSEQVMYMKSVQDTVPARFGRIEKPLSPKHFGTALDTSEESYDHDDSFCQEDDEVEYMDVGVFTQAMNQAKVDIAVNSPSIGRVTRRGKRNATNNRNIALPKQRRRIIINDDSD